MTDPESIGGPLTVAMAGCTWALRRCVPLKGRPTSLIHAQAGTLLAQSRVLGILLEPGPSEKKWVQKNKVSSPSSAWAGAS